MCIDGACNGRKGRKGGQVTAKSIETGVHKVRLTGDPAKAEKWRFAEAAALGFSDSGKYRKIEDCATHQPIGSKNNQNQGRGRTVVRRYRPVLMRLAVIT